MRNQKTIMKRVMWIASALLTLGAVGCNRSTPTPTMPESALPPSTIAPSTASGASESTANPTANTEVATRGTDAMGGIGGLGEESCPFRAEPDTITTVDVPDGAALVFRTSDPEEKRALSNEVSQIASTQNAIEDSRSSEPSAASGPATGLVPSATQTRAEDTDQGVLLVFTTDKNVSQLRDEVRDRAEDLNGRCTARGSVNRNLGTGTPAMSTPGMNTPGTSTPGTGSGSANDQSTSEPGTGSGSSTQPQRP